MVGLPKVYLDIYETSKDVVRLKQRHLIKEVVERLNLISTPQETVITLLTSDQVRFFFGDILSLIIDSDSTLQTEAIKAIVNFLSKLQPSAYQNSPEWSIIRDRIVEDYTKYISKIRDSSNNANWYKIWCLLINILDQDIIRSVSIINKFLAIVEQSFKSPDLEVRAQAFICWKILVKTFAKYNELVPLKRVKLVSIPFRSSQAKNLLAAETKLDAYWFFLIKLSETQIINDNVNIKNCLELHQEMVFGPFLQFCFGSSVKGGVSTLKQYPKLKEITVFVLIAMLNSGNKEIDTQLETYKLEKPKEAMISEVIMRTNWKAIMRSCLEASLIIVEECSARKKMLELLWHGLINVILQTKNAEIYKECCTIIKQLIQTDKENAGFLLKPNILQIVEKFGSNYNYLYDLNSNTANYVQIFEIVTCLTDILILNDDQYFPSNIFEPIIQNIYAIEKYSNLTKFWELQKDLIEYILTTDQLNDFSNFQIKICIWKTLSTVLRNYMDAKLFEFRLQSKYEIVNKWIMWPFKKCGWITETNNILVNTIFDNSFFIIWKRIMHSSSNAEGKSNFVNLLIPSMKMLCDKREKIPNFDEVFACYVDCMDKTYDKTSKPTEVLDLIKIILSKAPSKNTWYNKTVEKFTNYVCCLNDNQIGLIFEEFKSISSAIVQAEKLKHITKNCFEIYKKTIIDLLKKESFDKKYLKDFRNALKSDEFVIIPSVWALNPDRLTDHQKEKMKEKNDNIPALYNDMHNNDSHSQDSSSIKPWTPNKIVIHRGKEQHIISSPKVSNELIVIKDGTHVETEHIRSPFKKPKENIASVSSNNKNVLKKTENKMLSPVKMNKNVEIKEPEIIEKENVEKAIKDSEEKEKKTASQSKTKNRKSSDHKSKITKEEEKLLKSMNIEIQDEKKKSYILNNLKALQIDTVEGKNLLRSTQFQASQRGIRTRKAANPKKITGNLKKGKGINDKKNNAKKSLSFEKEKKNDTSSDNKNIKVEIEINEKIMEETNKSIDKNLQNSNSIINHSEDEIIEASQRSESIIARRLRKSSGNLTTPLAEENKNSNLMKGPVKTPSAKKCDNSFEQKAAKTTVNILNSDEKTRTLRSSLSSPENDSTKTKKLNSSENEISINENKKVCEMETELNTELLQPEVCPLQSPTKLRTLRNNTSTVSSKQCNLMKYDEQKNTKEENKFKIKENEIIQKVIISKEIESKTEANKSPIKPFLKNIFLENSEIPPKSELKNKSPRKRLQYDKIEDDTPKNNFKPLRNIIKDLETDTSSSDSTIFPSLVQSPNLASENKTRNNFLVLENIEISPRMQKLLHGVTDENIIVTRTSPRKLSNIQKQNLNIAEMDTQLNTENITNTEKPSTPTKNRARTPRKLPNWTNKKISEMDTEPNTEILNTSIEHNKKSPEDPSTPKRSGDIYQYKEDRTIDSPAYSPIKPFNNCSKKSLNQSIVASPECRNTDEKNEEFLNDTLNISPILIDDDNDENVLKNTGVINEAERLFEELKTSAENVLEENKHASPTRKSGTRSASLNSPPDRKNTNNSTSPAPKSKAAQSSLTGRGAQLINMIRNRKIDSLGRFTSSPFQSSKSEELSSSQEKQQQINVQNVSSPPKNSTDTNNGAIENPANDPNRDLLTFSKVLPSPYASPSASILKRKLRKDSFDDFESPANKRKRVSFHDPPVSITKEYVKHIEEDKPTQSRLNKLIYERTSTPSNNSMKHSLKRKNRLDSMLELARFNDSPIHHTNVRMIEIQQKSIENLENAAEIADANNEQQLPALPPNSATTTELQECDSSKQIIIINQPITGLLQTSIEMDSLKLNATADSTTNPQQNLHQCNNDVDGDELRLITPSASIYFTDEAAVLKYVVEKFDFDEIYEKYSNIRENKEFLNNKLVRTIFKDLLTVMEKDVRIKTNVLEMLSEKHPKECLDHAIQENLSSVVCERLNTNSVIDYICETFKNNADSRKMILDKISNILTTDRFNQERHEYFTKLLHYEKMSPEEITSCIEIIVKNRR